MGNNIFSSLGFYFYFLSFLPGRTDGTFVIIIIKRQRGHCTFRLKEPGDVQGIMCNAEGLFQILPGGIFQSLLHVHQAGINGFDDSQESQPTPPAARKVLDRHTIPDGK